MIVTYDQSVNAAYIYLLSEIPPGSVKMTYPCDLSKIGGQINLDFDAFGKLVGVEILGASSLLPKEFLEQAKIIG